MPRGFGGVAVFSARRSAIVTGRGSTGFCGCQVQEEARVVVGGGADGRGPLEREAGVDGHGEGDVRAARVLGGAVEQLDDVAEPEGEGRGPGRRGEGRGGDVLGAAERAQLEPGRRRHRDAAALHVVGRAVALEAVRVDDDRVRPPRGDAAQGRRVRAVARRPGGHERGRVARGDLGGRARALVGRGAGGRAGGAGEEGERSGGDEDRRSHGGDAIRVRRRAAIVLAPGAVAVFRTRHRSPNVHVQAQTC